MGLRGPPKNPNAQKIRSEAAKLKYHCRKACNQLIDEFIAEYIAMEYSQAVKSANKVKKPSKRIIKSKNAVVAPKKVTAINSETPKVIELWTKGDIAKYEYNMWMQANGLSKDSRIGKKAYDAIGLFICNLFETKKHFGIVAEYYPDIRKFTVVYDDRTRNLVPLESLSLILIENSALEGHVQEQLREYVNSKSYLTFMKFHDTA